MGESKKIIVNNRAMGYKPSNISHNINPPPVALLLAIMILTIYCQLICFMIAKSSLFIVESLKYWLSTDLKFYEREL